MAYTRAFRKFAQGDKVSYDGRKFSDLGGKLGIVDAYVANENGVLVVSFGDDAYVIAESNLRPFQGHLRSERQDQKDETKNPDIQKRKGGKRKPEDQEAG